MSEQPRPPTGPYHDFWLLSQNSRPNWDYKDLLGRKDAPIHVPDDVLRYFHDCLQWVPTFNPSRSEGCYGLNYYGPTVITGDGARKLCGICGSLATLFQYGSERLVLTGNWTTETNHGNDELERGYYEKFLVDRDWLVGILSHLADLGYEASQGKHFILHLGV